ncbi:hypothetical protein PPL_05637 [Heterostelium album PN500]|uniref:Methyltransferase domain-containing protein n=1 Tax=Heterostelium pallidum (strain ATCC 26659 / Pp 5 / PN500) TaxID=670386 RepID=D3BAQ7_HETP5|nr:hypothetical protein PPL_05637 [Heterostelium album PN500]EFA81644.1 hypothetical protein PPL_05637 [Heterostelium album PN500]|eukprot:XP_020433761.1 hypothetical protein PPL_05637 [Heterostelium album PN500]
MNIKDEIQKIFNWIENQCQYGLIDLRTKEEFQRQHIINTTNIPLDQLPQRIFELPPRGNKISFLYPINIDDSGTITDLCELESYKQSIELRDTLINRSGYLVEFICYIDQNTQDIFFASLINDNNKDIDRTLVESGSVSRLLWKACSFLESSIDLIDTQLLKQLQQQPEQKPSIYYSLDLACGSGRDALFIAKRGHSNVIAVDHDPILLKKISDALPRYGIPEESVRCVQLDLEPVYIDPAHLDRDHSNRLETNDPLKYTADELNKLKSLLAQLRALSPVNGYHLVHVARYLYRPLLPIIAELIVPGGFVVFHTFMHPSKGKPKRPRYLLNYNELKERFTNSLFDIIEYQETLLEDNRPIQFLLARKQ